MLARTATLPRHLRNHILRLLRPAESAVRRLVIIAARELVVVVASRKATTTTTTTGKTGTAAVVPSLPLLDALPTFPLRPPRRRPKAFPRITFIGLTEPTPIPENWIASPDDPVSVTSLCRRLAALKRALDDLDKPARRLARWRARRDLALKSLQGEFAPASAAKLKGANNGNCRFHPMRPGRPPGHRKRPIHEIDDVLRECHSLAHYAQRDDTS